MRAGSFILFLLIASNAYCLEPVKTPILKIETGMHTAVITRISMDSKERYLVSGSLDKTIRLWELSTGNLIKTLRPPIGDGDEGKIYAVSISPDGKTIAAGGWTGYEWDEFDSIYIFDTESGSMIKRLKPFPSNILNILYSKDGRYLVASLARGSGIRVYRTSDYSLILSDTDYAGDTYGIDIDKNGRVVSASYDGFLRLYDESLKLIEKKRIPGGRQPYSVRFSPDGEKIAVGFNDSTTIVVLSTEGLTPLYFPDTSGVDNGDLSKVSWSSDGSALFAGGRYAKGQENIIFRWQDGGQGKRIEIPASSDTIMHIIPLKDGGAVYCTADPLIGIISGDGTKRVFKRADIADLRTEHEGFMISPDGTSVLFNYEGFGRSRAVFSVSTKTLTLEPQDISNLSPPLSSASNIEITDWKNSTEPKLNTLPIALKSLEVSRSVAVSYTADVFFLGTEWYLRLYDNEGYDILIIPAPGTTWAVNIPQASRVGVAAFGDGTIRWYSIDEGTDLLYFFPHRDKKRWVLWTPSGYYETSQEGETIFGWHINKGKDKASDFKPANSYKEYRRPDIISLVLTYLSEEEAESVANSRLERQRTTAGGWRVIKTTPKMSKGKERRRVVR